MHTPGKPEFKYVANMHGNEVVGREMLLLLADYLCSNYGRDERVTKLVNTTRIHLLPSMNPDGWESSKEGDCSSVRGRFNANGVDLNRNFPDPYDGQKNELQPETQAVMNWIHQEPFVLSANLHGGTLVVNYPFDNLPRELKRSGTRVYYSSPDDDILFPSPKFTHWRIPQCTRAILNVQSKEGKDLLTGLQTARPGTQSLEECKTTIITKRMLILY